MNSALKILFPFIFLLSECFYAQTVLTIFPDSIQSEVNKNFTPGVFYVPKTADAATDFTNNGIFQNSIRTNVIESVLNNSTNLNTCLTLLSSVETQIQEIALKCDKLIFIFEKMPAWLSSSADGSPASTSGWYVLNTKPPSNWNEWQQAVDSITSKITNDFGITNAYFEVWNEPDLGSWSATMDEYFTLYKRTFDGIKSANLSAKVGGPAVNFWANNIYWQPPYGHKSNTQLDSSLIGQLLDSCVIWNKVPDFISWHNFNLSHQEFAEATAYIKQKFISLALPEIPLIISEWNAPSQVRDTKLATSFMLKAQMEISKTIISNNTVAAWQDFNPSMNEFHNDYGMLTYGTIHKPAYNSLLLSEKLMGSMCKMTSSFPFDAVSSVANDTLYVLVSNYCPPPFLEAFNHTLFEGNLNANQLDSAGFIDIGGNNFSQLDSIYRGLILLPNSNALQITINNSIPVYQHFASIITTPRAFLLKINGFSENYTSTFYKVDSIENNMQFKYDSLLSVGFNQATAISEIINNQAIHSTVISINDGEYTFSMKPNVVCLFKVFIPTLNDLDVKISDENPLLVYPNPSSDVLSIIWELGQLNSEMMEIRDFSGKIVRSFEYTTSTSSIDIRDLPGGIYFLQLQNNPSQKTYFIKK